MPAERCTDQTRFKPIKHYGTAIKLAFNRLMNNDEPQIMRGENLRAGYHEEANLLAQEAVET